MAQIMRLFRQNNILWIVTLFKRSTLSGKESSPKITVLINHNRAYLNEMNLLPISFELNIKCVANRRFSPFLAK